MSVLKAVGTLLDQSSKAVNKLDKSIDSTQIGSKISGKWNDLRFTVSDLIRPTTAIKTY